MALKGCSASFSLGSNAVADLTSITNSYTSDSLAVTDFRRCDESSCSTFWRGCGPEVWLCR